MKSIIFRIGLLVLLAVTATAPLAAEPRLASQYTNLWIFGDSLSDTGNLFALSDGAVPPSPPYFDGRFSNGPVWAERFAKLLGVDVDFDVNAFVDPGAANRAIGGALSGYDGEAGPGTGLLSQVDDFLFVYEEVAQGDLVVIWVGANDYLDGEDDPSMPVGNIASAVVRLADAGASSFVVLNMPNLGDTPAGQASGFAEALNTLAAGHNAGLAATMAELAGNLVVDIVVVDINAAFEEVIRRGHIYGVEDVTTPCLDDSGPTGVCPFDGAEFDATGVAFWDPLHPTTFVHQLLAQYAYGSVVTAEGLPVEVADRERIIDQVALGQLRAFANSELIRETAVASD